MPAISPVPVFAREEVSNVSNTLTVSNFCSANGNASSCIIAVFMWFFVAVGAFVVLGSLAFACMVSYDRYA